MNRAYSVCLAVFAMLGSTPLVAQNASVNECLPQYAASENCPARYETEFGLGGRDRVEPLARLAARHFVRRQYEETDRALDLAREAVRLDEGLFTRSQVPFLIMQAENFSNSADWAEARGLQDHLIWLFRSKFRSADESMIDELRTMSRLHLRGTAQDNPAWRAHHYIRALYVNRLAIDVASAILPANDGRKAELIHERLQILHSRASQAMEKSLLLSAAPGQGHSPAGSLVLDLSEKLTLRDMRREGDRAIATLRQLAAVDGNGDPEELGIVNLYAADWQLLFDGNADVADLRGESGSLFERAGIAPELIDELMRQPLLRPGMKYLTGVRQILNARSGLARNGDGAAAAISFASVRLRPFAGIFGDQYRPGSALAAE